MNMDRHESEVRAVLADTYGKSQSTRWWVYWRVFFMACAELWGYRGGEEWLVSHYLFEKPMAAVGAIRMGPQRAALAGRESRNDWLWSVCVYR